MSDEPCAGDWAGVLAQVVNRAHLAVGEELSSLVDDAVRSLGLTAELFLVDLAQRVLTPIGTGQQLDVDATPAGRCYQLGAIVPEGSVLWVPVLDGTDRVGVLRVGLADDGPLDVLGDTGLQRWLWVLAGGIGHIVMTKVVHSDRLRRIRTDGPLSQNSELLWQLLPPRTFATEQVVVSAVLEPYAAVAGDAYDYNVERDAVGSGGARRRRARPASGTDHRTGPHRAPQRPPRAHDRRARPRRARRRRDHRPARAAALRHRRARAARHHTGALDYLIAGHPAPLLLRGGTVIKELDATPRVPLGVTVAGAQRGRVSREQLQTDDRLLFYSDGVVEARNREGVFFGEERLVALLEEAAAAELSAPEMLRRLTAAVLRHQGGSCRTTPPCCWSSGRRPRTGACCQCWRRRPRARTPTTADAQALPDGPVHLHLDADVVDPRDLPGLLFRRPTVRGCRRSPQRSGRCWPRCRWSR